LAELVGFLGDPEAILASSGSRNPQIGLRYSRDFADYYFYFPIGEKPVLVAIWVLGGM